jgi:hypothetical protein
VRGLPVVVGRPVLGRHLEVAVALLAVVDVPARVLALDLALGELPDVLAPLHEPVPVELLALLLLGVVGVDVPPDFALGDVDLLSLGAVGRRELAEVARRAGAGRPQVVVARLAVIVGVVRRV